MLSIDKIFHPLFLGHILGPLNNRINLRNAFTEHKDNKSSSNCGSLNKDDLVSPDGISVPWAVISLEQRNLPAALHKAEEQKDTGQGVDAFHGYTCTTRQHIHTHIGRVCMWHQRAKCKEVSPMWQNRTHLFFLSFQRALLLVPLCESNPPL